MQIWAESGKSALPICNYSQILYQFLTFTQNLKRSHDRIYHISTQESKQHYLNNHTVGSVIFFGTFLFIYHMITLYHSPFGMSMKACSPSLTLIISCVT